MKNKTYKDGIKDTKKIVYDIFETYEEKKPTDDFFKDFKKEFARKLEKISKEHE